MTAIRRIVCVGNRYARSDEAGPLVYDALRGRALPVGVEAVDGGLGGLLLLEVVDGCELVVFVDAVEGFAGDDPVVLLDAKQASVAVTGHLDHGSGLTWLLHMLPSLCSTKVPDVRVVGVEGAPTPALVQRAADLALKVVVRHARSGADRPKNGSSTRSFEGELP